MPRFHPESGEHFSQQARSAFRAWYHAWYMCATYAGDFNKFPPLGEYVKTRPNLKDLLG